MNKIIFIILILCVPAIVNAQFNQGDAFLGGTLAGSYTKRARSDSYKSMTSNSITVSPVGGYFVNRRLAIGLDLSVSRVNNETKFEIGQLGNQATSYSTGVLGRYFFSINEKFMFALTGNIYYSRSKTSAPTYADPDASNKSYSMGMTISPTFLYFPARRWGFEANIGQLNYAHQQELTESGKNDNFTANYGSISLGVAYYFRKP